MKIRLMINGFTVDEGFYSYSAIKELEEVGFVCIRVQ